MLLGMIRQLHIEMGRAPAQTAAQAAAPPVAVEPAADPWGANLAHMQEQFRPLHPAMVGQTAEASARGQRPAQQPAAAGSRGLGSLVWFFGVYFFFQWLLGRGS